MNRGINIAAIEGKGRGVIAEHPFTAGCTIEVSPIIVFDTLQTAILRDVGLITYCFPYWYNQDGEYQRLEDSVAIAFGLAAMLNHTSNPNVDWVIDPKEKTLSLVALHNIQSGAELTMDYKLDEGHLKELGWAS